MRRNAYIGTAGVMGGSSYGTVPIQPEATAYFGRMTTPPSDTFKAAVNWAIYRWKQQGVYNSILGLWIHAADTAQAALLSVIGDTPRDAVYIGSAPTFTALKGFSGFDSAHQLKWPITSTILSSDLAFNVIAGRTLLQSNGDPDTPAPVQGVVIAGDAGTGAGYLGNWSVEYNSGFGGSALRAGNGGSAYGHIAYPGGSIGDAAPFVGGVRSNRVMSAGSYLRTAGLSTRTSNYRTVATDGLALNRMSAYAWLSAGATDAQCLAFTQVLSEMLNQLGALT